MPLHIKLHSWAHADVYATKPKKNSIILFKKGKKTDKTKRHNEVCTTYTSHTTLI